MKEDDVQPADGDDEMHEALAMGWRITEVEPHSCQLVLAQPAGSRVPRARTTAFSNKQLAGVLRPLVLDDLSLRKASLGALRKEMAKYQQRHVTVAHAWRARNECIEMMHGETRASAARLPAIADEMIKLGYYAIVHYATKAQMIGLTLSGMKSQHEQAQRRIKKNERVPFNKAQVLGTVPFLSMCRHCLLRVCICRCRSHVRVRRRGLTNYVLNGRRVRT